MDAGQFEAMSTGADGKDLGPTQVVPAEYSTSASKLTFAVPEGGSTDANFDL